MFVNKLCFLAVLWCGFGSAWAQENATQPMTAGAASSLSALQLEPTTRWEVQISPAATYHYNPSDEHRPVRMVAFERQELTGKAALHGGALFTNSFGQPSAYWYPYGRSYSNVFGIEGLYAKWTAGIIYGYVGKYKDKVPLNYGGFSPGIIPALGYQANKRYSIQLNMLGAAGLMLSFNAKTDSF
jgi:hypothetical protein